MVQARRSPGRARDTSDFAGVESGPRVLRVQDLRAFWRLHCLHGRLHGLRGRSCEHWRPSGRRRARGFSRHASSCPRVDGRPECLGHCEHDFVPCLWAKLVSAPSFPFLACAYTKQKQWHARFSLAKPFCRSPWAAWTSRCWCWGSTMSPRAPCVLSWTWTRAHM